MRYEVEQKFRVDDLRRVEGQLGAMGVEISAYRTERDQYFNHPSRDFAATDEAVRIRRTDQGARITYKGPKVDATTKTRRELELKLDPAESDSWSELLVALGFRPVVVVEKRRRKAYVECDGNRVEVSLDEVPEVGQFVELELVADEHALDAARRCLARLAAQLGLAQNERRSYLELLLRARGKAEGRRKAES